jgi:hypothetical protein
MKTQLFILIFLLIHPLILSAQNILRSEQNQPRVDDRLVKELVEYYHPKETGEGLVWDFSRIRTEDNHVVSYFSRDDRGLIGAENGALLFYAFSGDSMLLQGYENATNLVRYHSPGLWLKFPVVYGSSSGSEFNGRGKHDDRLESLVRGRIQTVADALGSLILPGNDTLSNVIQVHIRKTETTCYSPLSSGFDIDRTIETTAWGEELQNADRIVADIYQWYEEGYRYPVFETVESYRSIGEKQFSLRKETYFYHPAEQVYALKEDTVNRRVLETKRANRKTPNGLDKGNIHSFYSYPNPVKDRLNIDFSLGKEADIQIQLIDSNGNTLYQTPVKKQAGASHETIDMSSYPVGNYLIILSTDKEKISKKIVKH